MVAILTHVKMVLHVYQTEMELMFANVKKNLNNIKFLLLFILTYLM